MVELELKNLHIMYDDFHAVKGVNLKVENAEILTLLGPSGCGKTSILRTIAGFQDPAQGHISIEGEDIIHLPAQKRDMGMIFQSYALWPHMTVEANIAYGLNIRKVPKEEQEEIVAKLVKQVQLEGHEKKLPTQLSGGQQQRVALARALAISPRVLLCDEPLSNLDFKLRVELRTLIREIAKDFGVTVIYVTHDQTEALAISDKIAVMDNGVIIQIGSPLSIYSNPNSLFVADFIGENNKLHGNVTKLGNEVEVTIASGETLNVKISSNDLTQGDNVTIVTRYSDATLAKDSGLNTIKGKIKHKAYMGKFLQVALQLADGTSFTVNLTEEIEYIYGLEAGAEIYVQLQKDSIYIFKDGLRVY